MIYLISTIIIINVYTHFKILNDEIYLTDKEKRKYFLMLWFLPIIGVLLVHIKLNSSKKFYLYTLCIYIVLKFTYKYILHI